LVYVIPATYAYIQEQFDIFITGYGGPDYYDLYITAKEATDII